MLELEAEPFPSQLVYVNMVAARVLTILMHFRLNIVSQSQDSKGNFIAWTLVTSPPMIRRNYVKKNFEKINNNVNLNTNRTETYDMKEVIDNEEMSQILVKKNYT